MKKNAIRTPEGTRDFLFSECTKIRKCQQKLSDFLSNMGYSEIITPGIEFYDVFTTANPNTEQESMLKFNDKNGSIVVLRPDSTTPIARVAATRIKEEFFPLKLSYCQNVYRSSTHHSGQSAEIMQVGAELIGVDGKNADLDILSTAICAIEEVNPSVFRLEIGHADVYKSLISSLNVDDNTAEEIRSLIESKSFAALNDALEPFKDKEAYRAIRAIPSLFGGREVLTKALELTNDKNVINAIEYLIDILDNLDTAGLLDNVIIDLGMVHEIDYYTGIMFRGYAEGAGDTVLSGGRYNNLTSKFGKEMPSVGFAIDIVSLSKCLNTEYENKINEVVFYDKTGFKTAINYLKSNEAGTVVLSPCSTIEETKLKCKTIGVKTIAIATANEISKITI